MRMQEMLIAAAVTGLLAGCGGGASNQPASNTSTMSESAKHACKGQNNCKGQGGCKVEGKNACKGQNDCKGQGGCKVT